MEQLYNKLFIRIIEIFFYVAPDLIIFISQDKIK